MMKKPIIQFEDFTFQYQAQLEPTLKDINLTIYQGEKVLIVGPSGSGKSTLGQCLNGIIPNIYKGQVEGQLKIDFLIVFMINLIWLALSCRIRMVNLSVLV